MITCPTSRADAEDGSLVRLFVDGVQVAQGTAASPVDFLTLDVLTDGEHELTATAEDAAGNPQRPVGAIDDYH